MRDRDPLHVVAVLGVALLLTAAEGCAAPPRPIEVVPMPTSVVAGRGSLQLGRASRVSADRSFAGVVARQLAELRQVTGLPLSASPDSGATVRIERDASQPEEGYVLEITRFRLRIGASTEAGVFYAFQTLRQLLSPPGEDGAVELPVATVRDAPRFPYRGLHLDVGRHFFDVEEVERYVDAMSRFKLNRFHWHLTEDQGWRVEIDAYPKLTEIGAWRAESPTLRLDDDKEAKDGVRHGGFYTKEQMREVVEYAAERYVTVIPEIELPGHATAAIAAYPELGCKPDERLGVGTRWGVYDTVFCPSEETFEFLETVLDEVMEIFPSEWIHVGGDEVPKTQWEESEVAQRVMEREGLESEEELQSWFIHRIEDHLNAKGRRLIGWDEILEGGLAPNATVMSWRGTAGGIAAAKQGHEVVMTPIQHAYFDFYQGPRETEPPAATWAGFPLPLERVYEFEPVPLELSAEEARLVIGAQGNLWTERIPTPEQLEYMAYPRALAMAEVVWSPKEARDWEGFVARLPSALRVLDELGVRYRDPVEASGTD